MSSASRHVDISQAYLNAKLEEEIFVMNPIDPNGDKVWKLKKALYGLRQSANAWNKELDEKLKMIGFQKTETDPCLYKKESNGEKMFLVLVVDDMFIEAKNKQECEYFVKQISKYYEIRDLGEITFGLGMHINFDENKKDS